GIVPGGGVALVRVIGDVEKLAAKIEKENESQAAGARIVAKAMEAPIRAIAKNAGVEGSIVLQKVRDGKGAFGYNAATDVFEDLMTAGVIDPTKVTRSALQNAASAAGMLLLSDAL